MIITISHKIIFQKTGKDIRLRLQENGWERSKRPIRDAEEYHKGKRKATLFLRNRDKTPIIFQHYIKCEATKFTFNYEDKNLY